MNDNTPIIKPIPEGEPLPPAMPKREVSKLEKILIPIALLFGLLGNWIVNAEKIQHSVLLYIVFLMGLLVTVYALHWKKFKQNRITWIGTTFFLLLCLWYFLFDFHSTYGMLTLLLLPMILMTIVQMGTGGYKLKEVKRMVAVWLMGWFFEPFSEIPKFFQAIASLEKTEQKFWKKVMLGVLLSIPVLWIAIMLLSSADQVFAHIFQSRIARADVDIWLMFVQIIIVSLLMLTVYSFLWNKQYKKYEIGAEQTKKRQWDPIVSYIVLGALLCVYLLFCVVQFTYLFAGRGLPESMTYSEYAREGFGQLIWVTMLNLGVYGLYLLYVPKTKVRQGMLLSLILFTGIMLLSGFVRLSLYLQAYQLTWLRLISFWFMIFLSVVLLLCIIRMFRDSFPLFGVCAIILLGWYTMLGMANPDKIIVTYNLTQAEDAQQWIAKNEDYIAYELSSDAYRIVLDQGYDFQDMSYWNLEMMHYKSRETLNPSAKEVADYLQEKLDSY